MQLACGRIDPQAQIDAGTITWTGNGELGDPGRAQPAVHDVSTRVTLLGTGSPLPTAHARDRPPSCRPGTRSCSSTAGAPSCSAW